MKLSIITINYNNKDGLQKTIDSVIVQTWRDFEWIIIDGGSTDGSKELIEHYQEHFAYWCSEPDKGIYNAMNKGITHCKGEYISCMNSGDCFYESTTLEKVFSVERTGDIIYGDWMQVFADHVNHAHMPPPIEMYSFLIGGINHQAIFFRTSLLKQNNFDESYKIAADRCRYIQAAVDGNTFEFVDTIVAICDMSGVSHTNTLVTRAEEKRIDEEVIPQAMMTTMRHLAAYEKNEYIVKVFWLLQKGKALRTITKWSIDVLHWLSRIHNR